MLMGDGGDCVVVAREKGVDTKVPWLVAWPTK